MMGARLSVDGVGALVALRPMTELDFAPRVAFLATMLIRAVSSVLDRRLMRLLVTGAWPPSPAAAACDGAQPPPADAACAGAQPSSTCSVGGSVGSPPALGGAVGSLTLAGGVGRGEASKGGTLLSMISTPGISPASAGSGGGAEASKALQAAVYAAGGSRAPGGPSRDASLLIGTSRPCARMGWAAGSLSGQSGERVA
eukprot:scaffold36143_cov31-Tisochrysis_lutea.AAC.2